MKIIKRIILSLLLFLLAGPCLFAGETANLEDKMDAYTESKRVQWDFNPFNRPASDKYFNSWTDPLAYNSYWYMYYPPKIDEIYDRTSFKLDDVLFYHNSQLATDIAPIAFHFDEMKYRFYIGVGFLWSGYFMMYGNGETQLYGTHLFLDSVIQVEPYIDFIYKDKLRVRLTPIRHICYHMSGDILGDKNLFVLDDGTNGGEKYKDVGFEQVHTSVCYQWGWFNFYGGLAAAVTNLRTSSYVNLANFYCGTEMKLPLYAELNLIAGLYVGGNYDRLCNLIHDLECKEYKGSDYTEELTPTICAGVGLGIYDWVIGFRFDYARSRQMHGIEKMETRMGLSAYKYL